MPDGVTLEYNPADGSTMVAGINITDVTPDDTDFEETVSGDFHAVLKAVFQKIRGIFALLAGKLNIQQNALDEGKAMVIGSDGKLAPGVSGKVDAVDGVEPGADKNVKLTWGPYETKAGYEADKDNIPEGARVILAYEYPDNLPNSLLTMQSGTARPGILGADDNGAPVWLSRLYGVEGLYIKDTRDESEPPLFYINTGGHSLRWEFKRYNSCDNPFGANNGFYTLQTIVPWTNQYAGGGIPMQLAYNTGTSGGSGLLRIRKATNDTAWGAWGAVS
jgi:hypothetical protein